jgi:hypothetical protein
MSINLDSEMRIYADFMTEIKTRQGVAYNMIDSLRANPKAPDAFVQAEIAILQTRLVCELVGLAAVAAHRSFGLHPDVLKSYQAPKIFQLLKRINPECFPKPMTLTRNDAGIHLEPREGQIEAKDLERIYTECGSMLHRGVFKHVLEGKPREYDLILIEKALLQITGLLNVHVILLLRHNAALVVTMRNANDGVGIFLAASDGPSVYVKPAQ